MSTLLTETPRRSALKRRLAEDEETPKKKVSFSPQPTTVHEIPLIGRRRLPPRKLYDAGADSPKTTPVRRRSHTEILGEAGTSAESSSIPTSPTLVKQPSATTQKFTGTPAKATPRKLVQAGANSPKAALGEAGASAEGSSSPTPPASAQRPTATARISTGTPIFLPDLTGPSAAKKPRVTSCLRCPSASFCHRCEDQHVCLCHVAEA
ncbi:hypothetical protein L596_012802 [Steinernema carpocapsae]|uniref:Uncharacterized protein n=1 Tax=Steinernema carpocapsae TaxID=34508 RepID=A0A4U5NZ16_STECR|nr:hypothetical protein L596_012802 [Steinernema carpocapsae]